jgi:hypothetical protein
MLPWYYQLAAIIEHYNIRIRIYFLIPILLVTACTASYASTANDIITTLQLLTGLMVAFEIGTDNSSYREVESQHQIVRMGPYVIFLLSNLGKLICACLLLFRYNPYSYLFEFVYYCVLAQTVATFIFMIPLFFLFRDQEIRDEYRSCRRQMESILPSQYNSILN